jgi:endonuclease YncB( thermonuclease family)
MGDLVPFRRKRRWTTARDYSQRKAMHARSTPAQDTGWLAAARGLGAGLVVVSLAGFSAVWLMDGPPPSRSAATVYPAAPAATQPLAALPPPQADAPPGWDRSAAALEAEQPQIAGAQSAAASGTNAGADSVSARFGPCHGSVRVACVVDGDTIWYRGTRIRVADINAPEVSKPGCAREAMLGDRATKRLTDLLNAGDFALVRPADSPDRDKYGRTLRELHRNGDSLGAVLVREGLAEEWGGVRIDWC